MNIFKLLELEEGYREKPYHCSEGYPTIGIGKRIGPKNADLSLYEFTCSKPVAYAWLDDEIAELGKKLKPLDWFTNLNEDRRAIIVSMCYQLGLSGVMKFKKMIAAISSENWEEAAKQALDSKWAKQTPARAKRHAEVLRTGSFEGVY